MDDNTIIPMYKDMLIKKREEIDHLKEKNEEFKDPKEVWLENWKSLQENSMDIGQSKELIAKDAQIAKLKMEKWTLTHEKGLLTKEKNRLADENEGLTMLTEELSRNIKKLEQEKLELQQEISVRESVNNLSENLLSCSLCYYTYNMASRVPTVGSCGHTVCSQCTQQLSDRQCPICRAVGSFSNPSKNFFACDILNRLLKKTQLNGITLQQRDTILLIGGWKNDNVKHHMTILSGDRSSWIELQSNLPFKASGSAAVYLNEEIYLIGGFPHTRIAYKLDKNLKWIRLADMNAERSTITNSCLEWNGYIWVLGGKNKKQILNSVERYDPMADKWTQMPDMRVDRGSAAAVVYQDRLVITGGEITDDKPLEFTQTAECLHSENGQWMELPSMPNSCTSHSLVSYKDKLVIMGGMFRGSRGFVTRNTVYELALNEPMVKWKQLPSMKYIGMSFAGIVLDEEIYAIGGDGARNSSDRVEIFDGEKWRAGPSLPYGMSHMSAVIIPQHLADRLCNEIQ